MTYEEVDARVHTLTEKNLVDLVSEEPGIPDWDEENFQSNVQESLQKGAFIQCFRNAAVYHFF